MTEFVNEVQTDAPYQDFLNNMIGLSKTLKLNLFPKIMIANDDKCKFPKVSQNNPHLIKAGIFADAMSANLRTLKNYGSYMFILVWSHNPSVRHDHFSLLLQLNNQPEANHTPEFPEFTFYFLSSENKTSKNKPIRGPTAVYEYVATLLKEGKHIHYYCIGITSDCEGAGVYWKCMAHIETYLSSLRSGEKMAPTIRRWPEYSDDVFHKAILSRNKNGVRKKNVDPVTNEQISRSGALKQIKKSTRQILEESDESSDEDASEITEPKKTTTTKNVTVPLKKLTSKEIEKQSSPQKLPTLKPSKPDPKKKKTSKESGRITPINGGEKPRKKWEEQYHKGNHSGNDDSDRSYEDDENIIRPAGDDEDNETLASGQSRRSPRTTKRNSRYDSSTERVSTKTDPSFRMQLNPNATRAARKYGSTSINLSSDEDEDEVEDKNDKAYKGKSGKKDEKPSPKSADKKKKPQKPEPKITQKMLDDAIKIAKTQLRKEIEEEQKAKEAKKRKLPPIEIPAVPISERPLIIPHQSEEVPDTIEEVKRRYPEYEEEIKEENISTPWPPQPYPFRRPERVWYQENSTQYENTDTRNVFGVRVPTDPYMFQQHKHILKPLFDQQKLLKAKGQTKTYSPQIVKASPPHCSTKSPSLPTSSIAQVPTGKPIKKAPPKRGKGKTKDSVGTSISDLLSSSMHEKKK